MHFWCSRSPAGGRSQSPAPRSPLIGGSTMTSTNPAFASNLYDSTYSADSEGQRNPMYEAGGHQDARGGQVQPALLQQYPGLQRLPAGADLLWDVASCLPR